MSTNVPPVTGLTPAQVAVKLRTLVKNLYQQDLPVSSTAVSRMRTNRERAKTLRNGLDSDLLLLEEAIPRRKPSELRMIVSQLRGDLQNMDSYLRDERYWADKTVDSAGPPDAVKQIYALVQALPTVDNIPVGDAENTIRAIVAICKAHFGMLEQTLGPAPHTGAKEELLDVLMKLAASPEVTVPPVPVEPDGFEQEIEPEMEEEFYDDEEPEDEPVLEGPVASPATAYHPSTAINLNTTAGTGGPF